MDKKISVNYMYNLLYQLLSISLPVLTAPYVSRVLGPNKIGEYNYVTGIVTYFGIIAVMGTVEFGQREIARVQNDKYKRSKLFWEIFNFRLIFTLLSFLIYVFFIFFIFKKYILLFAVSVFTFLSWIFDVSWYFQGVEDFKVTAVRNSIVKISVTLFIFILVRNPNDVWIYTFIYSSANFIGNLTMIPYLKNEINFVFVNFKDIFSNFKDIMSLFLPVVAIQLYSVLNKIMLGAMSNTTQVGYFSQMYMIINLAISLIYAFVAVLIPRISALYNQNDLIKVKKLSKEAISYVYMLGLPMMIGVLCVGNLFIPIFFGQAYVRATPILYTMSPLFIIIGMGQLLSSFLVAINRQKALTIAVSVNAITNATLNYIVLKFQLGALGVSIVTVISELICTLIEMYNIKDIVNKRIYFNKFICYSKPSLLIVLCTIVLTFLITNKMLLLICILLISIIMYLYALWLQNDKLFSDLIIPIISKIKK